jgi:hypothetical protein
MADQRALFNTIHKVGLPDPKTTTSKRQHWILFLLLGLFLFATGIYATGEHVVHPTSTTAALAH